jgi:ubiquinone biosynthesis protein UbiJ
MPATPAWLAAAEAMLNRGIGASTQATTLARRLDGSAIGVEVAGLTAIRVSVSGTRLALSADAPPEAPASRPVDATIEGSVFALLQLARVSGGPGIAGKGAANAPRAVVRGDAEIANSYRQLMVLARPDFEEETARLLGDLPARRLSLFAAQAAAWARQVRRTAGDNVAEYLQEESRDLVSKPELDEFLQGVDALRETADRVAARLLRLERRLQGPA